MNIYEYAMKLEKDGEIYYRDLAEKIEDKAIKTIFILLQLLISIRTITTK